MERISLKSVIVIATLICLSTMAYTQSVPQGIHYQAVARDNIGKELSDRNIDVRFSIIAGNPLGDVVYQELHQAVRTSKYGVFTLIIGSGVPVGGTAGELSGISWDEASHFLKVEIKFVNDFSDMGTMQFLSVPYALFAGKSLEPGPAGPPGPEGPAGPPGDPATDNQQLSFDGVNLSISGSQPNTVNLSALINDADHDPANEIQYLSLKGDTLSITKGNFVTFKTLDVDDADADPTNEIQDLRLTGNILKITRNGDATEIDLTPYLDNTDEQALTWNLATRVLGLTNSTLEIDLSRELSFTPATNMLSLSGGNAVDLTHLKNDADYDPTNEIQDLNLSDNILKITNNTGATDINLAGYLDNTDNQTISYNPATYNLSISNGNSVSLGGMIAFRAKKNVSETGLSIGESYDFIAGDVEYDEGTNYDPSTGIFTTPTAGIYSFNVGYNATGAGDGRSLELFLNGTLYETINTGIANGSKFNRAIIMKLDTGDEVRVRVTMGLSTESGIGTFSGYRVY